MKCRPTLLHLWGKVIVSFCLSDLVLGGFKERPDRWNSVEQETACMKNCMVERRQYNKTCTIVGKWVHGCHDRCEGIPELQEDTLCKCVDNCQTQKLEKVCSNVGEYRSNFCELQCFGEAGGPPIKMCECVEKCRSGEHRPVCGENGNMYYNDCSLKCRNDTVTSKDISRCKKF